jgi:hypothetical protein
MSYQMARSFENREGDFAASAGFVMFKENMMMLARGRYIGESFDISQVGYVPWLGTAELTTLGGPRWYFNEGYISQILLMAGFSLYNKTVELYADHSGVLVFNMQFRNNWGFEFDLIAGRSKDQGIKYDSFELDYSAWANISPQWYGNMWGAVSKTYNFSRGYLGSYFSLGAEAGWHALRVLDVGTSYNMFVEGKPDGGIQDITYNARPFVSVSPVNDLNVRMYLDNVFVRSTKRTERLIFGFLFSYSFLPKSWIYLAVNEIRDRSDQFGAGGVLLPNTLHVTDRISVLKVKYLYYF